MGSASIGSTNLLENRGKKKNPERSKKQNLNLQHAGNYIHLHTFITIYNAGNPGSDTTKWLILSLQLSPGCANSLPSLYCCPGIFLWNPGYSMEKEHFPNVVDLEFAPSLKRLFLCGFFVPQPPNGCVVELLHGCLMWVNIS